jgi:HEAT repeat protein
MSEAAFTDETYARVLGLTHKAERQLAEDLVRALGKADRALLPKPASHPMAALLAEGARGVDKLLSLMESGSDRERRDAVDALAHLLFAAPQPSASARLKGALKREQDPQLAAMLAKALAIAGDGALMLEQMKRLGDDDPAIVASAARLLGFGRFKPAVPVLKGLVSRDHFLESRHAIWALGEIGDPGALPALLIALAHAFRVVDCLIAVGKIGEVTSIPHVTPLLASGTPDERDAAARALAMILDKNRALAASIAPLKDALVPWIERELADRTAPISVSTRYHLLLCLARLGHKLDAARLRTYLALEPDDVKVQGARPKTSVFHKKNAPKR